MSHVAPRKSPRKSSSTSGLTRTGAPRKRAPARCRICPGGPLKSSCACPPSSRRKKSKKLESASTMACPTETLGAPIILPQGYTTPKRATPASSHELPLELQREGTAGQALLESFYGCGTTFPVPDPLAANPAPVIAPIPFSLIPQDEQCSALPLPASTLISNPSDASSSPFVSTHSIHAPTFQLSSSSFVSGQSVSSSPSTSPSLKGLHQISPSPVSPSDTPDEVPGEAQFVEGAMQGTDPVEILRRLDLPEPLKISSEAVKRFGRVMRETIVKVERLAHETGSWIMVAGQHPHSKYDFLHFTSARLRIDAREESSQIVSDFGDLVSGMINAQQGDAREFQRSLREEKALRASEAAAHQAALDQKQAELDYALKMAAAYKESFGDLPV